MFPKINKDLLPFKAHFFFKCGGLAFLPMLPAIARQRGLSDQGVGIIWTVCPIASAGFNVACGAIADRFRIHHRLLQISCLIMSVFMIAFFILPNIPQEITLSVNSTLATKCENSTRTFYFCDNLSVASKYDLEDFLHCDKKNSSAYLKTMPFQMRCKLPPNFNMTLVEINNLDNSKARDDLYIQTSCLPAKERCSTVVNISLEDKKIPCESEIHLLCEPAFSRQDAPQASLHYLFGTSAFWLTLLVVVISLANFHASSTLADTLCTVALGKDTHKFGRQRLFGGMGIGIMGLIGGALVNYFSKGLSEPDYTSAIVITASFQTVSLLTTVKLNVTVPGKETESSSIGSVIFSLQFWLLMGSVTVTGIAYGIIWLFEYIYLDGLAVVWDPTFDDSKLLQGLLLFTDCCIGEILFFFFSSHIIKKLGSIHTFSITLSATALRSLLYSVTSNPWLFVPIHLLHGVSFAVFFANMITMAGQLAPKGAQATLQSAVIACFTLARSLGGFAGGMLLQSVGGSKTYLYLGIFVSIYTVIHILAVCTISRLGNGHNNVDDNRGNYEKPNETTEIHDKGLEATKRISVIFESQNQLDAMT